MNIVKKIGFARFMALTAIIALSVASVSTFIAPRQAEAARRAPSVLNCAYWSENVEKIVLRYGSTGGCVAAVQFFLYQSQGASYLTPIDGIYGHKTTWAVASYQYKYRNPNLAVDGVVGPQTWSHIQRFCDLRDDPFYCTDKSVYY